MNQRIAVSIGILACAGCDPRKPTVIDPAHPDHSYKWPANQPAEGKDMISYRVHIRLSEYDRDRLDGIAQAVYGVIPFRNETWAHDNSTGGVKAGLTHRSRRVTARNRRDLEEFYSAINPVKPAG